MLEKTCHNQDKFITDEILQTDWELQVGTKYFFTKNIKNAKLGDPAGILLRVFMLN